MIPAGCDRQGPQARQHTKIVPPCPSGTGMGMTVLAGEEGAFLVKTAPSSPVPPPTPKKLCSGRYGRSPSLNDGRDIPPRSTKMKQDGIYSGYKENISFRVRHGRWNKKQKPLQTGKHDPAAVRQTMPDKRKMRTGKEGPVKDRPHDDGAGEAQTKKARRRARRAGEHGQESRCRQVRTAEKGTGSRRHGCRGAFSRKGQRSSSLRRAENSSRRFSPGPGAGRRGIQPQPPFLKTQRMTRNMTMMPMTANNGPGI